MIARSLIDEAVNAFMQEITAGNRNAVGQLNGLQQPIRLLPDNVLDQLRTAFTTELVRLENEPQITYMYPIYNREDMYPTYRTDEYSDARTFRRSDRDPVRRAFARVSGAVDYDISQHLRCRPFTVIKITPTQLTETYTGGWVDAVTTLKTITQSPSSLAIMKQLRFQQAAALSPRDNPNSPFNLLNKNLLGSSSRHQPQVIGTGEAVVAAIAVCGFFYGGYRLLAHAFSACKRKQQLEDKPAPNVARARRN